MSERSSTNMTTAQLGKRMDSVESDLTDLKTESAKTSATVEGMRGDINTMFAKLDQWGGAISGSAATKGMIPVQYIWAALALFVSMSGLGVTLLQMSRSDLQTEMDQRSTIGALELKAVEAESKAADDLQIAKREASDDLLTEKLSHLDTTMRLMIATTDGKLEAVEGLAVETRDTVHGMETDRFTSTQGLDHLHRISNLEVDAAVLEADLKKTWDEIADHEDEGDHPLKQIEAIRALETRLGDIKAEQARRRDIIYEPAEKESHGHPHPVPGTSTDKE